MKWLLLLACGCSSPVDHIGRLWGEVHLHGAANAVHPAALFVSQPFPAERASGESIFGADAPPLGSCEEGLGGSIPPIQATDAGRVRIDGGSGIPHLELSFDLSVHGYLPATPLPPLTPLFAAGDRLHIQSPGAQAPAFSGELEAPAPLELQAEVDKLDGDLEIRWTPSSATRISLILVGSRTDGAWSSISCAARDGDGRILIPASLLLVMPPPPRDFQLQVSRDQIARVPAASDGDGVVLHAAYEVNRVGHED